MDRAQGVFENIKTRRSVRKYSDKAISDTDLDLIVEAGRWAPSGANAQPWRFVILRDRALIEAVGEVCYYALFRSRHVAEANAVIVILGDPSAGSATYIQDCTIAGTNMTLMAHALGIGSCWIGAFEDDTVRKILSIPDRMKITALISFGYAAREPRVTPRLGYKDIVHLDGYATSKKSGSIKASMERAGKSGPLSVVRQILGVLLNRRG